MGGSGQGIESSPAYANGVLHAGTDGGSLRVFDAATGATLKSLPTGGTVSVSSPAVSDGRVYIGSSDFDGPIMGTLHVYGPRNYRRTARDQASGYCLQPGPRRNLPGVAPVCSPSFSTWTPFTNSCTTPVAYWCGSA